MSWTLNHTSLPTSDSYLRGARRKIHISRSADLKGKSNECNGLYNLSAYRRCNYPKTLVPTPVPVDKDSAQTAKQQRFSPKLLQSFWPKFHHPPTTLADMSAEDTALWVEMLGKFKGWKEAKTYANSFKTNDVTGFVLPYLSVHALRSELKIVKFGHRLEIISAIEDNELTLMNPTIVSLRPSEFFIQFAKTKKYSKCNSTIPPSCAPLSNPWKKPNKKAEAENKWLFGNSKKPWLSTNVITFGESNSDATYSEADWISDPDLYGLRMFEETGSWNINCDSYDRMITGAGRKTVKKYRGNVSKSGCNNYPWIPPMELPPSMMKFDGRESEEEHLSTIFSNAKPRTATSCGEQARQAQDKPWVGIGTQDYFKREIQ